MVGGLAGCGRVMAGGVVAEEKEEEEIHPAGVVAGEGKGRAGEDVEMGGVEVGPVREGVGGEGKVQVSGVGSGGVGGTGAQGGEGAGGGKKKKKKGKK